MQWIVLLTMCVNVCGDLNNKSKIRQRGQLYINQLCKWLDETNLIIYVIESSSHGFIFKHFEEKYPHRLHIISFNALKLYPQWGGSSSLLEGASIQYAMDKIMQKELHCTHILKVTGRYFLPNIEHELASIKNNNVVLVQSHVNHAVQWQNTEYYGMKKELLNKFGKYSTQHNKLMEHNFYDFVKSRKKQILGPFPNDIPRGGDGLVLNPL